MAEQHLDDADIEIPLKQVPGKAVAQRVRTHALPNGDLGCRLLLGRRDAAAAMRI
jgi:hypothetical protein